MVSKYSHKIIDQYQKQDIIPHISISYKSYIRELYNVMYNIYKSSSLINLKIQKNINTLNIKISYVHDIDRGVSDNQNENILFFIQDTMQSKWIPQNISTSIPDYNIVSIFKFKYITIFFYKKSSLSQKDINDIRDCIIRIYIIKELYNDRTPVKIGLFNTLYKKSITRSNNRNKPIGPNNVNGGLCYVNHNIIILWRKEELKKVIIHELLHSLKLDKDLIVNERVFSKIMREYFKLNKYLGVNESYTETMACIYNCVFSVLFTPLISNKKSLHNKTELHAYNIKQIIYYIEVEIFYSIVKTAQILHYYKFKSINDLMTHPTNTIVQQSNVFSYYILKCFILYNFNLVFDILTNSKCIGSPDMKLKQNCSNVYLNIIQQIFNSKIPSYNRLNKMIETTIKHKYFINNSLRMTAIE